MTNALIGVLFALSMQSADSAAAVSTLQHFHSALAAGDTAAALRLLADDAVILEGGEIETRAEYRAHHLAADVEFAKAIASKRIVVSVRVAREVAWIVSSSITDGTFRERAINSVGAELAVLRRTKAGWKIAALHWSSHAIRR